MESGTLRRDTYRTLDEQQGRLSPAEERFERVRRTVGLFAGPVLFGLVLVLPLGLEQNQQTLAAILALVITYWVSEAIPIPITAVLGVALCVLLGVGTADDVFPLFGDSTIFLFIGGFIIAQAMTVHGLDKRFAFRVLSLPGVGDSTYRIIIAFGLIGAITSPLMSNTAGAAMLLPIALGVMTALSGLVARQGADAGGERGPLDPERLRFGAALMLVITYGITIGGLLLPIGSPPNLIGRELIEDATKEPITFFEWFVMALPIVLVMFVVLIVVILLLNRPEVRRIEGAQEYIAQQRAELGGLSRGERNVLLVLGLALLFWFLPGIVGLFGDDTKFYEDVSDRVDEGVVAIVAAALLLVLPLNWGERRYTLTWNRRPRSTGAPSCSSAAASRSGRSWPTRGWPRRSGPRSATPSASPACCRSASWP